MRRHWAHHSPTPLQTTVERYVPFLRTRNSTRGQKSYPFSRKGGGGGQATNFADTLCHPAETPFQPTRVGSTFRWQLHVDVTRNLELYNCSSLLCSEKRKRISRRLWPVAYPPFSSDSVLWVRICSRRKWTGCNEITVPKLAFTSCTSSTKVARPQLLWHGKYVFT